MLYFISVHYILKKEVCLEFIHEYFMYWCALPSTPNSAFKTHSTIRCDNTPVAYQTFTHEIWWVTVCYDLAHQIRWAKHTFSGRCDITPMVCCSFGGHSTPQFLQFMLQLYCLVKNHMHLHLLFHGGCEYNSLTKCEVH